MTKAINIDFETMGNKGDAVVLDLAAVAFDEMGVDKFEDLVADKQRTFHVKFLLKPQMGVRSVSKSTVDWWYNQSEEVQKILKPSFDDVTIKEGLSDFFDWCKAVGVNKNTRLYARGPSFDLPILDNILELVNYFGNESGMYPVPFWQHCCIRTAISYAMLDPSLRALPMHKDSLKGLIKHNSVHDVCKDVVMLQTAIQYADGRLATPEPSDLDSGLYELVR